MHRLRLLLLRMPPLEHAAGRRRSIIVHNHQHQRRNHELLDLTEKIREMILERRAASEIRRVAREEGMTFLRQSAIERVREGITTLREANKVTFIEG